MVKAQEVLSPLFYKGSCKYTLGAEATLRFWWEEKRKLHPKTPAQGVESGIYFKYPLIESTCWKQARMCRPGILECVLTEHF